MELGLFSSIYLLGAFMAILLGGSIALKKHGKPLSRHLLLALLASISIILIQQAILVEIGGEQIQFIYWLIMSLWFAISPLLYLYLKSILHQNFQLKWKHLAIFTVSIYMVLEWVANLIGIEFRLRDVITNGLLFIFLFILTFLLSSLILAIGSLIDIKATLLTPKQELHLRWISFFLYGYITMLTVSVVLLVFFVSSQEYSNNFEYWLLIFYEIFVLGMIFKMLSTSTFFPDIENAQYANSKLTDKDLSKLFTRLNQYMQTEKPFLQKKLSLATLAQQTKISESKLSQIFSQYGQTNFYDFVNQYRLQILEKRLIDPQYAHLKITGIAETCGFNSKAAFYKAFKKKYEMTPSEFIAEHKTSLKNTHTDAV